ncbi:hypothetical protein [Butyrivibrio sp. YAB3001]|uniref:hypothetical protein n=1 Tax=Butyrivibrio sp. YAB3001 TaxID=1520812 RepID=UPI0008F627D2|nr:hypothetical protein [Butyrivibrio sp. YAB3001]SFB66956.1 hypothetical protein SAMN02910398_00082 [Butyrivibrio sp. YAB3001]
MSINRIDFGVMAASSEVGNIKAAEEARPLMDQRNFQTQFNQEVDNKRSQITSKDDVGQGELHSDAKEKGSNEYFGDGGRNRKGSKGNDSKNTLLEKQLSVEKMEKLAGHVLDKNGKPVDFSISSGFDLKI